MAGVKATYGAWKENPSGLKKEFRFEGFEDALAFAVEVGRLAQQADHHPDIDLRFNKVFLSLVTHDAGCVTGKDRSLAAEIDRISAAAVAKRSKSLFS